MTEVELRAKIREIENERSRLKDELNGYELQLDEIKYQTELADRNSSIGKCYLLSNMIDRNEVKAFKILSIPEQGKKNYPCNLPDHYSGRNRHHILWCLELC